MPTPPKLQLKNFNYTDFFHSEGLNKLDERFLTYLKNEAPLIHETLLLYRNTSSGLSHQELSILVIEGAKVLEAFIAELFCIENRVLSDHLKTKADDPIFVFKNWYVLREAKRRLNESSDYPDFQVLNEWLNEALKKFCVSLPSLAIDPGQFLAGMTSREIQDDRRELGDDRGQKELAVAQLGHQYLQDPILYEKEIKLLTQWCVKAMTDPIGRQFVQGWVCFKLPKHLDYQNLIPLKQENESLERYRYDVTSFREREGFNLTDYGMSQREILNEANYCIYCHTHEGDFCSKGFPVKKSDPSLGLKTNPLNEIMTGCPLDEKVSEMNFLKKEGYSIAPLAVVMIDNPLCPATGHRICNDCMKACIYQKQTPVDIPQIETAVLVDVLKLPWGIEIYDLLTKWNPLRQQQFVMKPFNGYKIFVAGMGPAGFSIAHHLTMEGCAVVGIDGLKIEPLNPDWIHQPIYDWNALEEPLEDRVTTGFGGVSEYGITVRWNKNFLKLIYISLMRRQPYFKVFGNVRFGGTLTVEDIFNFGFDHLALAVGAGLPQTIPITNSLAPGMRQANDFLMNLQLMQAHKTDNLVCLQIRLPAVVIGGGLTAIDTATEAQAYYIRQVEKILFYYEILGSKQKTSIIRSQFNDQELLILDEFLTHAHQIRIEKTKALKENRKPNLLSLIESWGGVTIVYRRSIQESPAYRFNHEELKKALEEGVYYLPLSTPTKVLLDDWGQCTSLVCHTLSFQEGIGEKHDEKILPARSIFVATGSKPNIAYEFEHRGTFRRSGQFYDMFDLENGVLREIPKASHVKSKSLGMLTSYRHENRYVSVLGDTHPLFQGSVVKAIASSFRAYPKIMTILSEKKPEMVSYDTFSKKIDDLFLAQVVHVEHYSSEIFEIRIHAPIVCKNFKPGQFYRLQTYETCFSALQIDPTVKSRDVGMGMNRTTLQTEAIAALGTSVNSEKGEISFFIFEKGSSTQRLRLLKHGDPIAIMGPTGVRIKIPKNGETVLILGQQFSIPMVLALGKTMRIFGNRVLYIGCFDSNVEAVLLDKVIEAVDQIVWVAKHGEQIPMKRPQDITLTGDFMDALMHYENTYAATHISLKSIDRVILNGSPDFLRTFKEAQQTFLKKIWQPNLTIIASVYSSMQCMLKGICAQCLQWQIDPSTGERTKAVFACSWQDQPLEMIDIENLSQRLSQNSVQEKLYGLWQQITFTQRD